MPWTAWGTQCRINLIPNGARFSCAACHVNAGGGGQRNPFGRSVQNVARACNSFWNRQIASLDSDGDGLTNGQELGDPEGGWRSGQPAPGNPKAITNPGIKQNFTSFIRGDANCDGAMDISDAIYILEFKLLGSQAPCCSEAADADEDGQVSEDQDALYLFRYLFLGAPPPAKPFPVCGIKPGVGCGGHVPCND